MVFQNPKQPTLISSIGRCSDSGISRFSHLEQSVCGGYTFYFILSVLDPLVSGLFESFLSHICSFFVNGFYFCFCWFLDFTERIISNYFHI